MPLWAIVGGLAALMVGSAIIGALVFSMLSGAPSGRGPATTPAEQGAAASTPTAPPEGPRIAPMPTATPEGPRIAPMPTAIASLLRRTWELTLYSSLPRVGIVEAITESQVRAIEMALEDDGGRAGEATVTHVGLDDSEPSSGFSDDIIASHNAEQAIDDPSAVGFIGPFGTGTARAVIPVLCEAGLSMIAPSLGTPGLTKPGKGDPGEPDVYYPGCRHNLFRTFPTDDVQGTAGAEWAELLGAQRAVTIVDEELPTRHIAMEFEREAVRRGIEIVDHIVAVGPVFAPDDIVDRVRAASPDLVYYAGFPEGELQALWRGMRDAVPDVIVMASDWMYGDHFADLVGSAGELTLVTTALLPPEALPPAGLEFAEEYEARFGEPPDPFAFYAYDALGAYLAAIERALERDPASLADLRTMVLDEVAATREHTGVLHPWSFDENGDTTSTVFAKYEFSDAAFTFLGVTSGEVP